MWVAGGWEVCVCVGGGGGRGEHAPSEPVATTAVSLERDETCFDVPRNSWLVMKSTLTLMWIHQ